MDVIIETADGRSFKQEIWFFATVLRIKETIQKYHGFPVSRQTLVFNGVVLEDERDTEYYTILEGSRILLHLQPAATNNGARRVKVDVRVPGPGTRRVQVEMNAADNVSELRKELQRIREQHHFELPSEGFFFIYKQNVMDEDRTFLWHDFKSGDVIEIFNGTVTGGI